MTKAKLLTYDGRSQTIAQWAKEVGITRETLSHRLNRDGWSIERALTEKPQAALQGTLAQRVEGTQIARQIKTELLTDLQEFHRTYGAKALVEQMKKECDEGKAVKLYKDLIVPLFPKEDPINATDLKTTAFNIINHISLDEMKNLRPL